MNTFSAVFNLVHKAKKTTPPIFFTNCDFYANTLKDAPKSYNYVEEVRTATKSPGKIAGKKLDLGEKNPDKFFCRMICPVLNKFLFR